ncbi:MAG: ammonium transporter [Terrimicrobiaceae bacterium]
MKYKAPFLALLFLAPVLAAQEDLTSATAREKSSLQQELILQNTREILRRLETPHGVTAASNSVSTVESLSGRLAELEKKLAAGPQVEAAPAEEAPQAASQAGANAIWIITAGALVFFMQAGFCLLELGLTRPKNAINICMKNALDFSAGAICFLFVGFALMFGASQGGWIGAGPFWLSGIGGSEPFWEFWFFQVVFSGTAATIISGAMAERTRFVGYLCFTVVMTSLIYPVIGHWAWGSLGGGFGYGGDKGWLEAMGYIDFAGSSVVHGIGGAAALAGVLVLGPRQGRFREDGSPNLIPGHNLPLAALGTFILWFGWYGFNAGSTLTADVSIGRIAVNTTIAPSAGALAAMLTVWIFQGRPDLSLTLNGALGGLVGITANCHCVTPAAAVLIGLVAGLVATLGSIVLERLHVDDAVGAVPVHLFCGWWGILAVALFHEEGFSPARLGVQALGVASITAAAFTVAGVAFLLIDRLIGLRATPEEQDLGLDFTEHSGTAYAGFVTSEKANV